MNDEGQGAERLSPVEQRLVRLLALLRTDPEGGTNLPHAVVRTARWQLAVREVARAIADVAMAVAQGVAVVFGLGRRRNG